MTLPFAVVHPGTQHSWQVALALQQLDRLAFYATSIFYQPERWPYRIERYLPASLRTRVHREFRRFAKPGLDPARVRTSGVAEWLERIAARGGARGLARRIDMWGNARFGASLQADLAGPERFGLWGFDNAARELFRAASDAGRPCVLDRTIGHWRSYNAIMDAVYADYPEFFPSPNYRIGEERLARNDEEFALADRIVVGSEFAAATVRDNLPEASGKLHVLPYCYDEDLFGAQPDPIPRKADEPLRFLFVGQAGVRKGIHLVLKVFDRIPPSAASLTIVGDVQVPAAILARYGERAEWRPTVARADIPAVMRDADVLLFPTYFEGGGIVLYEALASGLGLIQSSHADIAVSPETGILLPELNEGALHDAAQGAIDDRPRVASWRVNAQAEAQRYSFARYREGIAQLLAGLASA